MGGETRNIRFRRYDLAPPSARVSVLLDEISRDPTGIFRADEMPWR
ncbi:DUF3024 domain-containing protein [Micromonospora sp. WMMD710]|nr:DUF3024 domain-containing protein [Micromonospora sp. WMMD710]MDG4757747.1 DUF3024 domain-containing protein [Micromonospora sp. WMMD710]